MRLIDADFVLKVIDDVTDPTVAKDVLNHIIATTPTACDLTHIEYVMKLHLAYINKIANTSDISKKKAINYIREHLKASTRSFVKWGDDNDNNNSAE